MSNGLERLKAEGSQKIYEATHISRQNIEAIFDGTYNGMSKIQLNGFLSILEREYSVDLSAVKADYLSRFDVAEEKEEEVTEPIVATPKRTEQNRGLIIAAIVLLALVVSWMVFPGDSEESVEEAVIEHIAVEAVVAEDVNVTDENVSAEEAVVSPPPEPALPYQLVVEPKMKLWMGYIDLATWKRSVKTTGKSVELDPEKGWLLVFGHGYFKVRVGDEVMDFSEKEKVYLIYQAGQIREIDLEGFKAHNRGANW